MNAISRLGRWGAAMLSLAVVCLAGGTARGAAYTWQGPGNKWNAAANWNPNTGPPRNAGDSATINAGPSLVLDDIDLTLDKVDASLNSPNSIKFIGRTVAVSTEAVFTEGRLYLNNMTWDGAATLKLNRGEKFVFVLGQTTIKSPLSNETLLSVNSFRESTDPPQMNKPATLSLARDFTNFGTVELGGDGTGKIVIRDGAGKLTNQDELVTGRLEAESREWLFSLNNFSKVEVNWPVTLGLKTDNVQSAHASTYASAKIEIAKEGVLTLRGASFVNGVEGFAPRVPQAKITGSGKLDRRQVTNWKNFGTIAPGITQVEPVAGGMGLAQLIDDDDPDPPPREPLSGPQTGILTFLGDYSMEGPANLEIQIGGASISPGSGETQYDRLHVIGNAAIGGLLDVSIIDDFAPGYLPNHDDVFDVLTTEGGAVSGFFTNASSYVFTTDGMGRFDVSYIAGSESPGAPGIVRLSNFVAVAEPHTGLLLGLGALMALVAGRRRSA